MFVFVISSYELFFHKVDAAYLSCDWDKKCVLNGQDCSADNITCTCSRFYGSSFVCNIGSEPVE